MEQNRNNSGAFNLTVAIRVLAAGFVFYSLGEIILGFFKGGEDAPSLTLLLVSILVLGGGGAYVALMAWREYKKNKAAIAEAEAVSEEVPAISEEDSE